MGWFNRAPEADPIGDICRSLAEEPWAWEAGGTEDGSPLLRHSASGVWFAWEFNTYDQDATVWFSPGGERSRQVANSDAWRLYKATQAHAAALVKRGPRTLDATCEQLVKAYQAGDASAALGLAERIFELCGGTPKETA